MFILRKTIVFIQVIPDTKTRLKKFAEELSEFMQAAPSPDGDVDEAACEADPVVRAIVSGSGVRGGSCGECNRIY